MVINISKWFNFIKVTKILYLAGILFIVISCSGDASSGGSSNDISLRTSTDSSASDDTSSKTPTDPTVSFNLFPPNYFTNYSKTWKIVGSDTKGNNHTMTIFAQTGDSTTFQGEAADTIARQVEYVYTPTDASRSASVDKYNVNTYYSTSADGRRLLGFSDTSSSTNLKIVPQTAKIGESGTFGSYTHKDGVIGEFSWKLEDGYNGKAKLITLYSKKSPMNVSRWFLGYFHSSETFTHLIDKNGNHLSITFVYDDDDNNTIKFRSN